MFLTFDGVGSLATENGLQIARFYPYLVELKLEHNTDKITNHNYVLSLLSGIETQTLSLENSTFACRFILT